MEDYEIVELFWERNESGILHMEEKYGNYCMSIAINVLASLEDAEECVNDTYLKAWNSIPPHKPEFLSTFLGKIVRNLSFDRYRNRTAKKRGGGETTVILDELSQCVSGGETPDSYFDSKELISTINNWLNTLTREKFCVFLWRYWYAVPISEIARKLGKSEKSVTATLFRIRAKLKVYLIERGYEI